MSLAHIVGRYTAAQHSVTHILLIFVRMNYCQAPVLYLQWYKSVVHNLFESGGT